MSAKNEVKYGFLIRKKMIFDTKIHRYSLCPENINGIVIYRMKPSSYKRLFSFENLLGTLTNTEIFEILKNDVNIKKERKDHSLINEKTLLNISNMAVIYDYPTKYLTQKRFYLYKSCQTLKKRLALLQKK